MRHLAIPGSCVLLAFLLAAPPVRAEAGVAAAESAGERPCARLARPTTALPSGGDTRIRCFLQAWQGPGGAPDRAAPGEEAQGIASGPVPLGWPLRVRSRISSAVGLRPDPFFGRLRFHAGLDLPGLAGTPVSAAGPGRVLRAGQVGGYGLMVEIDHGDLTVTRYGHLERVLVVPGETIRAGQLIGLLGSTGRSTGPHLHYELLRSGQAIDPRSDSWAGRGAGNWTIPAPAPDYPVAEVAARSGWAADGAGLPVPVIR